MANGNVSQNWLEGLAERIYEMIGYSPSSYMDLANLTPEMISGGFQSKYGLTGADVPPGLFQPFDIATLTSATQKPYSGRLGLSGQNIDLNLLKGIDSKVARQAYGGMAGTGAAKSYQDLLKMQKQQGMLEPLAEREKSVASGKEVVEGRFNQWQQILQDLTIGA